MCFYLSSQNRADGFLPRTDIRYPSNNMGPCAPRHSSIFIPYMLLAAHILIAPSWKKAADDFSLVRVTIIPLFLLWISCFLFEILDLSFIPNHNLSIVFITFKDKKKHIKIWDQYHEEVCCNSHITIVACQYCSWCKGLCWSALVAFHLQKIRPISFCVGALSLNTLK